MWGGGAAPQSQQCTSLLPAFCFAVLNGGSHLPVYNVDADIPRAMSGFQAEGREKSEGQVYHKLHHIATLICKGVWEYGYLVHCRA